MSRMSVAFAANREAITVELLQLVSAEELPRFNASVENIRRLHEEERTNLKIGEALADHRKRARYEDARVKREQFIATLQSRLRLEMEAKVTEYNGTLEQSEDKEGKPVTIAKFPDGSTARLPRGLWINYKMFDRP
jgi:predicted aminopeptidase